MPAASRRPQLDRATAIAHRLRANNLHRRLPRARIAESAAGAIQDTAPRSALVSLHARIDALQPDDWEHPALVQLWSPRTAVHVVPAEDIPVFTLGRLPRDPDAQRAVRAAAERVSRVLASGKRRKTDVGRALGESPAHRDLFDATPTGRFLIRWDARDTTLREVPPPEADPEAMRLELLRRHLRSCGPTTLAAFTWWAGLSPPDAAATWRALEPEMTPVTIEGHEAWLLEPPDSRQAHFEGVRFLPMEEMKLFGLDRAGFFVGPSASIPRPGFDTYHPGAVLLRGDIVASWGRRGGKVEVRLLRELDPTSTAAVEAEALSMPIPGATMSVDLRTTR
jgi:hypothetical protein